MDSSNSQPNSDHPASTSDPNSASEYSGYSSRTRSARSGGNSAGDTSPSAGNNNSQEPPTEVDNSSTSMQGKSPSSGYQPDNEQDMDIDVNVDVDIDTNSTEVMQPDDRSDTKAEKGKEIDSATSSSKREGKAEEIGVLTDLYSLHNKTGRYVFSGCNGRRDFYKFWIEEEGDFASKKELDDKVDELHARFLKNMDKNVDGPTDPIDVEIFRLSHWIWGEEIDSSNESDGDDQDCSKDSSGDDGDNGDNGVDPSDSKESGSVDKGNGKGFAAS